jgi:hypothetical protein
MTDIDHGHDMPAVLRMQLRALRTPQAPARELWPDIAAAMAAQPQRPATSPPRRRMPMASAFAAAAVLALALGLGWQMRPAGPSSTPTLAAQAPAPRAAPLVVVADAMTREYEGALREVPAPRPSTPGYRGLLELDASAAAVRDALAQDPDALFLLQRLQHIHARRLALARQLVNA